MCEDGATVAATPTFSAAGCLVIFQAGPAAFFHGVLQTIGKTPLTTQNVLPSTRIETPAIFRHLIGPPKQTTNETK